MLWWKRNLAGGSVERMHQLNDGTRHVVQVEDRWVGVEARGVKLVGILWNNGKTQL